MPPNCRLQLSCDTRSACQEQYDYKLKNSQQASAYAHCESSGGYVLPWSVYYFQEPLATCWSYLWTGASERLLPRPHSHISHRPTFVAMQVKRRRVCPARIEVMSSYLCYVNRMPQREAHCAQRKRYDDVSALASQP